MKKNRSRPFRDPMIEKEEKLIKATHTFVNEGETKFRHGGRRRVKNEVANTRTTIAYSPNGHRSGQFVFGRTDGRMVNLKGRRGNTFFETLWKDKGCFFYHVVKEVLFDEFFREIEETSISKSIFINRQQKLGSEVKGWQKNENG